MKICVCGWYLQEFDDFYMSLYRIKDKYPVHVVSNKNDDYLKTIDLPYTVRENTGLEWGAYNRYLMTIWDDESDVLFCHDDIEMNPVMVDGEIKPPEFLFDQFAKLDVDQAYVFGSRAEDVENHGMHGRMVFMSKAFLKAAKSMGGFYYDTKNQGYVTGFDHELREKYGCEGYNAGIIAFNEQCKKIGGNVLRKVYIPSFSLAKRGERGSRTIHYGRWVDKISKIIEKSKDKLHIGCGDNHWPEYTNVDLYNDKADIQADAKALPLDTESFDLIESHHLIEHMYKSDAILALKEWFRVLRKNGILFITCPDIMAAFEALKTELWDHAMHCIYGQEATGMKHHYGYSVESLKKTLEECGFVEVEVKTAIGYRPTPSLIAIARKP